MIVLDTDHVGIYQWPQSDAAYVLRDRLEACEEPLAVTIISVEEQMRGWLSEIKRRSNPRRQIPVYGRLQYIIGFLPTGRFLHGMRRLATSSNRCEDGNCVLERWT